MCTLGLLGGNLLSDATVLRLRHELNCTHLRSHKAARAMHLQRSVRRGVTFKLEWAATQHFHRYPLSLALAD